MATRDPKAWKISTVMEPNFEGGLIHNDWIKGTVFVKVTRAQRNIIPFLSRSMEADNTTMCFVVNDNTFYKLVNNPSGDSTVDSDWESTNQISGGGSIIPIGQWDISNTAPYLQDTDANGINGQFYYVQGAPNQIDVTHSGLFQGQTTQMINNDWVISVGTHWTVIRNTTDWDSLNRPQVIIDYENGIVIVHQHEISDINTLQVVLNSKYDDTNLADMVLDYIDVPSAGIVNVAFLRKHFYDKTFVYTRSEIDALLSSISVGDHDFDWNRNIRKLPVVGDIPGPDKLGEGIEEIYYGFIKPIHNIEQFGIKEVGTTTAPQAIGFVDPEDAQSITGDILIKDELGNIGGQVTPSTPPARTNFNQALNSRVISAGENQWYYLEYNYKKLLTDPDTLVIGLNTYLRGVYPFLTGMAATGLTGGGIYIALTKSVVDRESHSFTINGTNSRVYIAYPSAYGKLISIIDESGNELIGSLFPTNPYTLNIQSIGLTINWQVEYNVHEANYNTTLVSQKIDVFFDQVEQRYASLNLDKISEGIANKHFTVSHRDKVDAITVNPSDIGNMKESDYATIHANGIVDSSVKMTVIVENTSGSVIFQGAYIAFAGWNDILDIGQVTLGDKDSNSQIAGFATETIVNGATGKMCMVGENRWVDTTGQTPGSTIAYLGTAGQALFLEPLSGSLIKLGIVIKTGNPGIIVSRSIENLHTSNYQIDWRPNTTYPKNTTISYIDPTGDLVLVRAKVTHNSGGSYDPNNYELIGGDMQTKDYDPDEDGIVEHAWNETTTARNNTGVTIPKGRLVYINNFNSVAGVIEISLADKDTSKAANGVTNEDILDGVVGRIILQGTIIGISVPVAPLHTPLYLDTQGTFTDVFPISGLVQKIGNIIYGNTSGIVYFELGDTHAVTNEDWVTGRPYIINESTIAVVVSSVDDATMIPILIRCKVAHTSNVLITDYDSGYWEIVAGDMLSWIYDPNNIEADAFNMDSMVDGIAKVAMTGVERTKLAGLEDAKYKGIYATADALRINHPAGQDGWSADVTGTSSTWIWDSSAPPNVSPPTTGGDWVDSGIGAGGDMQQSIYDPTSIAGDSFNMDNFAEGSDTNKLFFTSAERTKLSNFLDAANYYNKTEADNLLLLKASINYVDGQDALQMSISTYDPSAIGGDVFDMDDMVEGINLILTATERSAISNNASNSHSHSNILALNAIVTEGSGNIITTQERIDLNQNTTDRHIHSNKVLLDSIIDTGVGEAFLSDDGLYKEAAKAGIHNGTIIEKQDIFVVETGGIVYVDIEKLGGGDLTVYFGEKLYILNCTTGTGINGRARTLLVEGSTTIAQSNNVYIYLNAGVATLSSETTLDQMPSEFAWVGVVAVRNAANVSIEGAMLIQRFNDSVTSDSRGRISYMGERLRAEGSKWWSDVDQTVTLTPNAVALDSLQISVVSGMVYQLHRQIFPVRDSAIDGIYVSGVSGTGTLSNYDKFTDLNAVLEYSDGSPVLDGDYFNIVIWGSISKDQSNCKIFVNPSAAGYSTTDAAYNDGDNLANLSVPVEFRTVGFLIARIPLKYTTVANGTLEFINVAGHPEWIDLRGVDTDNRDDGGIGRSLPVQTAGNVVVSPSVNGNTDVQSVLEDHETRIPSFIMGSAFSETSTARTVGATWIELTVPLTVGSSNQSLVVQNSQRVAHNVSSTTFKCTIEVIISTDKPGNSQSIQVGLWKNGSRIAEGFGTSFTGDNQDISEHNTKASFVVDFTDLDEYSIAVRSQPTGGTFSFYSVQMIVSGFKI